MDPFGGDVIQPSSKLFTTCPGDRSKSPRSSQATVPAEGALIDSTNQQCQPFTRPIRTQEQSRAVALTAVLELVNIGGKWDYELATIGEEPHGAIFISLAPPTSSETRVH